MKTLSLVGRVAALALLAEVIATSGLWWPDGLLAPIPVWASAAPNLAAWRALTALLCLGCAWAVVDGGRRAMAVALTLLLARCGVDRVLWQPYVLEQCALLAGACFVDDAREEDVTEALRWLLGLVFVWGGAHKWNDAFLAGGLAWLPFALPPGRRARRRARRGRARRRRDRPARPPPRALRRRGLLAPRGRHAPPGPTQPRRPPLEPLPRPPRAPPPARGLLARGGAAPLRLGRRARVRRAPLRVPARLAAVPALRVYTADSLRAMYFVDDPAALPPAARAVARHEGVGALSTSVDLERWAHAETGGFVPPEAPCFRAVLARLCARSPQGRVLMVMVQPREPRIRYERCAR